MAYTLNNYYKYSKSTAPRIEVYLSNEAAASLLSYHKQNGAIEISVCDCVSENAERLPMPDELMKKLDAKITTSNSRVVVTGVDAYLSLVSTPNANAFMVALQTRIDTGKLNVAYLMSNLHFDNQKFANPKYEGQLSVVRISNGGQYMTPFKVTVVSSKWVKTDSNPSTWNSLLKTLGKFEPTDEHTLVLENLDVKQAWLSANVSQLLNIVEIAERYYGLAENLPKQVIETLVEKSKKSNTKPLESLKSEFGQGNLKGRLVLKRLLELRDDDMWAAYLWMIQKTISNDSYLKRVIGNDVNPDNLLRKYIIDTAVELLSYSNSDKLASERAEAIRELGSIADSLIISFIERIKSLPNENVACWLNCGTEAERIEIVRRVSESDLIIGVPQVWHSVYPALTDYLSDEYKYIDNDLTEYFRNYRRFKITNTVTDVFVKKAFDYVLPPNFITRDSILQDLSADESVALLIVDGMGAEYLPFIVAMANRRGINFESPVVATVRLPSSTEFNHIQWDDSRILPEIHGIDNISHNGAEKYEQCSAEQNIVATFTEFDTVFRSIADGLTKYKRIVLTADHGSSRLAVIAHNKKMDSNLQWNGEPQDWRYSVAPTNTERPVAFESYYDADKNVTYWIVRGYNRLPKQGGKLSVHGGATLEERLVPIIVFTNEKSDKATKPIGTKSVEQLVEKIGFDEI